jgi:hypothetical protein
MYSNDFDLMNPDFVIDCREFKTSASIYDYIRSFGNPKIYCYAICYRKGLSIEFLKIGESAPSPSYKTAESIGERIKRQLNHVPGWEDPPYYSDHGNDFWSNTVREINVGNLPHLTKDDLIVGVWNIEANLHKIDFYYAKNKELSTWVEGILTEQYKKLHDRQLPILNKKDPTRNAAYRAPKLTEDLWEVS